MRLAEKINGIKVDKGEIALFYLAQAGFCIKTAGNKIIVIDAYLSDAVERLFNFKRMIPSVIKPEEFEAVKQQGVGEITANFTVWALACVGGALVNILYAVFWMTKKKTWNLLFIRKDEFICGALFGAQFLVSVILMGRGMVLLGILGASVGYGIQQSMQVIGNQVVGFVGGEWLGVKGKPRKTMYLALGIIFLAVIILAYSNTVV